MTGQEPQRVDDLAARMGRSASEILAELAMLEVAGRVTRLPGGLFMRPLRMRRADR
jgi:predicted Rossmann fold nucleotide-binding protein DprA/Smf involved in DNA uptake